MPSVVYVHYWSVWQSAQNRCSTLDVLQALEYRWCEDADQTRKHALYNLVKHADTRFALKFDVYASLVGDGQALRL